MLRPFGKLRTARARSIQRWLAVLLPIWLTLSAHAGPAKVFGAEWAWCNNFEKSALGATFASGSTPGLTVSFDFVRNGLYGYPACIRGWHYGWNPANDSLFPAPVASLAAIPCTFSYSATGANLAGDFAYDLFLRRDNAKSTPQLEIMVWAGNNSRPIGTRTGINVLKAGGQEFDLWEGPNTAAGYYVYTFIPHTAKPPDNLPAKGRLDLDLVPIFQWLQANRSGHFDGAMYLDVVEAGFEIVRGTGSATMSAHISASRR